jgi:hypothetical protein
MEKNKLEIVKTPDKSRSKRFVNGVAPDWS